MVTNKKKGYSLIELMFVMVLLVLFGLTTFTLVISGSDTYNRLTDSRSENAELRIAITYAKMELRQNDVKDSISVRNNFIGHGKALVIEKNIGKDIYEKWIYCNDGKLKEVYVKKGSKPDNKLSIEIANISGFEPEMVDNGVGIKVSKAFGTGGKSYSTVIALNSGQ